MIMFKNQKNHPAAILIDGSSNLMSGDMDVEKLWPNTDTSRTRLQLAMRRCYDKVLSPLDRAIEHVVTESPLHKPLRQFAFSHNAGMSGALWHSGAEYQLAVIGSPERVFAICDMTENEREIAQLHVKKLSSSGASVVAVAEGGIVNQLADLNELAQSERLSFMGFVSLTNKVDLVLQRLVKNAKRRGAAIYLMTGAHQQTAFHLAHQVELAVSLSDVCDARMFALPKVQQENNAKVFACAVMSQRSTITAYLQARHPMLTVVDSPAALRTALVATK